MIAFYFVSFSQTPYTIRPSFCKMSSCGQSSPQQSLQPESVQQHYTQQTSSEQPLAAWGRGTKGKSAKAGFPCPVAGCRHKAESSHHLWKHIRSRAKDHQVDEWGCAAIFRGELWPHSKLRYTTIPDLSALQLKRVEDKRVLNGVKREVPDHIWEQRARDYGVTRETFMVGNDSTTKAVSDGPGKDVVPQDHVIDRSKSFQSNQLQKPQSLPLSQQEGTFVAAEFPTNDTISGGLEGGFSFDYFDVDEYQSFLDDHQHPSYHTPEQQPLQMQTSQMSTTSRLDSPHDDPSDAIPTPSIKKILQSLHLPYPVPEDPNVRIPDNFLSGLLVDRRDEVEAFIYLNTSNLEPTKDPSRLRQQLWDNLERTCLFTYYDNL